MDLVSGVDSMIKDCFVQINTTLHNVNQHLTGADKKKKRKVLEKRKS